MSADEETGGARSRRAFRIEPEMLVGISAVIIGVCALGVSLYETNLMRREQRAEVLPLIELSRSYYREKDESGEAVFRFSLQAGNVGIGPAQVRDFYVYVDGEARPTWGEAMRSLLRSDEPLNYVQSTINGRTLPPDREVTMFDVSDHERVPEILSQFGRMDIEACFCSIFDECWTARYSRFGVVEPVEDCRRTDASFQE